MAGLSYNIVNFCRLCKKRFVSKKGDPKMYYCVDCQKRIAVSKRAEEKAEEKKVAVEEEKAKEVKKREVKKKVKTVKKVVKKAKKKK